ncbi:MAG: glycosyltransferase family 9 protein [Rhabdochlamydiaceae bacterium]|nr:glycosyltransferase family 9 protein [Candidatus Amphrikana amoebophyrae]
MNAIKNRLILLFIKLVNLFQTKAKTNIKQVLIVSTTGLGDTVWASPAIAALKSDFPDAKLHLLATGLGKETLFQTPHLEDIHVITYQTKYALWKLLRKNRFDTVLLFHASQRYIFPLIATIGANVIAGTKGLNKGLDSLFTHLSQPAKIHEIERRGEICKLVGLKSELGPLQIDTSEDEMAEALNFLRIAKWDEKRPIILMQPGAKDHFKLWPAIYYAKVANELKDLNPFIIITGSMNEAKMVQALSREIEGSIPLFGQVSLRALISIIKKASLLITNDTGTMHLGFSQNTPTIALFSPTDPKLCGPRKANNCYVISKRRSCIPCLKKRCADPFCMRQISVKEVVAKAREIL